MVLSPNPVLAELGPSKTLGPIILCAAFHAHILANKFPPWELKQRLMLSGPVKHLPKGYRVSTPLLFLLTPLASLNGQPLKHITSYLSGVCLQQFLSASLGSSC